MASKTILIVEDQADIRKLLRLTLTGPDRAIHEADNGADALVLLSSLHPDVLILDVDLPGEPDGLALCRAARADSATRQALIVIVSAHGQRTDIAAGFQCGADHYLVKPFSPLELIETVKTLDTIRNCDNMQLG